MNICTFDPCENKAIAKGLCKAHYLQKFRGEQLRPLRIPKAGCNFKKCDRPHQAKGFCQRHYQQQLEGAQLAPIKGYRSDSVSYRALHTRIRNKKGSAEGYSCVECGVQAAQWSYDHSCPFEKKSKDGLPYSADLRRYQPMCHSCHRKFDNHAGQVLA